MARNLRFFALLLCSTAVTAVVKDAKRILAPIRREQTLSFDKLQGIVVFIGYGSSGSSLIGAMIDAHPKSLIANEFNMMKNLSSFEGAEQLYSALAKKSQKDGSSGRTGGGGYSYWVEGQWQGQVEGGEPILIGDKRAGFTLNMGFSDLCSSLQKLGELTQLPIKLVFVNRNPYDNIATRLVKHKVAFETSAIEQAYFKAVEEYGMHPVKMNPDAYIGKYFQKASEIIQLQQILDENPYAFGVRTDLVFVDYDALTHDALSQMKVLCHKLGIECNDDYLNATSSFIRSTYHYTRLDMDWSQRDICTVAKKALEFSHLAPFVQVSATPMNPPSNSAYKCWGKCFPGNSPCPCAADYASTCQD